jgi:hypothetical protein
VAARGARAAAGHVGGRVPCEGRNRYSWGSYCPLRWEPSPIDIALARAEYAAWHRGLATLADTLQLDTSRKQNYAIFFVSHPSGPASYQAAVPDTNASRNTYGSEGGGRSP